MRTLGILLALVAGGSITAPPVLVGGSGGGPASGCDAGADCSFNTLGLSSTGAAALYTDGGLRANQLIITGSQDTALWVDGGAVFSRAMTVDGGITSGVANGAAALTTVAGGRICLNGATCSSRVAEDGFGKTIVFAAQQVKLQAGDTSNPNQSNGPLTMQSDQNNNWTGGGSVNGTDPYILVNAGLDVARGLAVVTVGNKALRVGTSIANSLNVPVWHDAGTPPMACELVGPVALSAGTKTVTFDTAFSVAPGCNCNDQGGLLASATTISTTQVVITGTGTDTVNCLCCGAR